MPEYLVVPAGLRHPHKWYRTEDAARAAAVKASSRRLSACTVTRVSLDGVEPIANYANGSEVE